MVVQHCVITDKQNHNHCNSLKVTAESIISLLNNTWERNGACVRWRKEEGGSGGNTVFSLIRCDIGVFYSTWRNRGCYLGR